MLKMMERRKAAQPTPSVMKMVEEEMFVQIPLVFIILMVSPDVVITRVTTVKLKA